jgi:hypothetical protein
VSAELNGYPIEVRKYVYPGKAEWHSFYIDLSGYTQPGKPQRVATMPEYAENFALGHTQPGKQRLAVTVDWKK